MPEEGESAAGQDDSEKEGCLANVKTFYQEKWPTRLNIALMLFLCCFITYMLRVNLSLILPEMTTSKSSNQSQPDYGPRYNWTEWHKQSTLAAYYQGYMLTSLFGGPASQRFGPRGVGCVSMFLSAILNALSPGAAALGVWWLFSIRFLIGAVGGVVYPTLHTLVARWAPPDEKGKFVAALLGGNFGTVVTWPLLSAIIEGLGWEWSFYITTIISILATLVWLYVVANRAAEHPRIAEAERAYVEKSLSEKVAKEQPTVPWLSIVASIPFWALLLLHFGNLWGLYFILNAAPLFMKEVLKFDLKAAGFMASLPSLARLVAGFAFAEVGDRLLKRNVCGATFIRKTFTIFSHIIPGLFLIGMGFANDPYLSVALMTLSLGFNGASTMTSLQNSQDLAPNFAGTLYGIINFTGTATGFITPYVVAGFTHTGHSHTTWSYVFFVGAAMYIGTAVIFQLFGSGQVQPWNEPRPAAASDDAESQPESSRL